MSGIPTRRLPDVGVGNPAASGAPVHSQAPGGTTQRGTGSRYDEALRAAVAKRVEETLARAQQPVGNRSRRVLVAVGLAAAAVLLLGSMGRAERPASSVPFGRDALVSAQTVGLGVAASDLAPPPERPARHVEESERSPLAARAEAASPRASSPIHGGAPPTLVPTPDEEDLQLLRTAEGTTPPEADLQVLYDEDGDAGVVVPAPAGGPRTVNVGTRLPFVLEEPVVTAGSPVPVTASVETDLLDDEGHTLIRAGSRLVGEAIATTSDDRVQVLLTALVMDGTTHPVRAVALGPDHALGMEGKLIGKGRGRAATGKLLGALGTALSFGLGKSGSGLGELAAGQATSAAGDELRQLEKGWQMSDKVIRLPHGSRALAYFREDLTLP